MDCKHGATLVDIVKEIHSDVQGVRDTQIRQSVILERNTDSLEEHMRRTNLLETALNDHKNLVNDRLAQVELPSKAIKLVFTWIVKLGALAGVIWTSIQIYNILTKL